MTDPLEGFRTQDEPDEFSDEEAVLVNALRDRRGVLEIINAGLDMQRFLATPAGKAIWKQAEETLAESVRTWLETSDCTTPEVKNAHFNAACAIRVLKAFQDTIDTGREMAKNLRHTDEDEDPEAAAGE